MRFLLLLFIIGPFFIKAQITYDTIIDRGIYKSFFNRKIKQPIAVVYKLYRGGGEASRDNDRFVNDRWVLTLKSKDYANTGYDKGHLANAEDFAYNDSLQNLTFRYYNCVPQTPQLNRGKWKKYETEARKLSQQDTVVIVCYNFFRVAKRKGMAVPAACYKAVFNTEGKLLFKIGFENSLSCRNLTISREVTNLMADFRDQ